MEKKLDEMIAELRENGWGSEITESIERLFRSIAQHIDGMSEAAKEPAPETAAASGSMTSNTIAQGGASS